MRDAKQRKQEKKRQNKRMKIHAREVKDARKHKKNLVLQESDNG